MELAPLPRLQPGRYSLNQVLDEVIRVAKEQPLRFSMWDWVSVFEGNIHSRKGLRDWEEDDIHLPECGTVACAAGWANLLIDGQPGSYERLYYFCQPYPDGETRFLLNQIFMNCKGGGNSPQTEDQVAWFERVLENRKFNPSFNEALNTCYVTVK